MGMWKTIGDGIANGVKFVIKNRKQIQEATEAVKDTAAFVSDMSSGKKEAKSEKEYYANLEEENEKLKSAITEISEGIEALETLYETKFQELEEKIDATTTEIAMMKESTEGTLRTLRIDLSKLTLALDDFQKKTNARLLLLSICSGVGVFLAIILSVVL